MDGYLAPIHGRMDGCKAAKVQGRGPTGKQWAGEKEYAHLYWGSAGKDQGPVKKDPGNVLFIPIRVLQYSHVGIDTHSAIANE